MKKIHLLPSAFAVAILLAVLPACTTTGGQPGKYTVKAFKPKDPSKVVVKVSTSTQNIYVKEGNRLLMAVQGCVGDMGRTPLGSFRIFNKLTTKRSGSYGFTSSGGPAEADKGQNVAVGYPMAFWCEFAPAYGFHEGFVWSVPRTHGCIRMHKEAAARFFQLVKVGTPVSIAKTQPEDAEYGHFVRKLDQRNEPNPPTKLLMSPSWFTDPAVTLLIEE